MKKLFALILAGALLTLSACGAQTTQTTEAAVSTEAETAAAETTAAETTAAETTPEETTAFVYPEQTTSVYKLMEGTEDELEVTLIESSVPGPTIYIVGGIHGDEPGGWTAAIRMKDTLQIKCGSVHILSPANKTGAEDDTRYVRDSGDMNRAFPGDPNSTDRATRIAAYIYADVEAVHPDLVLDLHEARWDLGTGTEANPGAGLANTIIYTLEDELADLAFEFIVANESGDLCSRSYGLTTPGIEGSFNRKVSELLNIPVITTETWRTYDLERRVSDQLEMVYFFMNYYGVTERYVVE